MDEPAPRGSRRRVRRQRSMPLFEQDRADAVHGSPLPPSAEPVAPPQLDRDDPPMPLYVQAQGAKVSSRGERLVVDHAGESIAVPAKDLCQLVLCGGVAVTSGAIGLMSRRGLPILHATSQARPRAITAPLETGRGLLRRHQCLATADPSRCLEFSRRVVAAKIDLQRTLLRRNALPRPGRTLRRLKELSSAAAVASDLGSLRGLEGLAARLYFRRFDRMLRGDEPLLRSMTGRNRRPPRDPVNAMLSFGYALLLGDAMVAALSAGLEPSWGFLHEDRAGRPALALDLMEEFRSLVVDSAVVSAINRGMIDASGFERRGEACLLNAAGRTAMIRAYEQRMSQWVTPPGGGRRQPLRAVMHGQARRVRGWLSGENDGHVPMASR
jgi:CRISPR-associated protein Cas1